MLRLRSMRRMTLLGMVLVLALLLQACGAPAAAPAADAPADGEAAAPAGEPVVNSLGVELPADAAPLDQQVLVYPFSGWRGLQTLDFYEAVYSRADAITDILSDSLVRLDKNFEAQPGAATDWSVDESGLVWTFNLDPNLMWNDGTPVTSADYLATFQYGASPDHAWDFAWYFQGIINNWTEAVNGEVAVEEIGVEAIDEHTLQFTTVQPAPFLPAMLAYSTTFQQAALDEYGGLYNSDPETSVSSGPYRLVEFDNQRRVVYEINPDYKGTNVPMIEKLIVTYIGEASQLLPAYEANEIDFVWGSGTLSPADLTIIENDPELTEQYYPHYGDFRTYYFFFDDSQPPFDNLQVRQAFAHALDRDAIINAVIKSQGVPAYSFLAPGFPASDSEAYAGIYPFDVETAQQLLADAGYPGGEGFPALTLALRGEGPAPVAVAQAYAAALTETLGIEVEVANEDVRTYMDQLNAEPTEVQFSLISYGMDFLDPSNMLGVFNTGGRHTWSNADYDALVQEAATFTGDPAERVQMFQDAEQILVEDVGGVFVYHQTPGDLIKPYLAGEALEPDANGVSAWHWPYFSSFSDLMQGVYITDEVTEYRPDSPQ